MSLKKDNINYTVSPKSMDGRREVHINYSYNGKDYKRSVVYVKDNPNYNKKDYIREVKNGTNTEYNVQLRPKPHYHFPIIPILFGLVIAGGLGVGGYYLYKTLGNNKEHYNPGTQVEVKTDIHDPYKSGCKVTLSNTNAKVNEKYETKITLEPASENARYQYRLPDQLDRITSDTVELEGGQFVYTYKNDLEAELSIDAQYVYGPVNVEFTLIQFTPASSFVVSFIGNNSFATYKGNPFISDSFDIDKGVSLVISPSTTGGHYKLKDAITLKVDDNVVDPSTYSYLPIAGTDSYQLTFIVTGKTDIYVSTTEYCVVTFTCEPKSKEPIWVVKDEKLTSEQLMAPTYNNHSFLGWYNDDTLLEKFDATKAINTDVTLYGSYVNGDINEPLTFTCTQTVESTKGIVNLAAYFYDETLDEVTRNLFYRIIRYGQQPGEWTPIACADPNGNFTIKKEELDDHNFVYKNILPNKENLDVGDQIQFKGNNTEGFSYKWLRLGFTNSYSDGGSEDDIAIFDVSGNIMSIIYANDFALIDTIPSNYCFSSLFNTFYSHSGECVYYCNIVNANKLVLPATILSDACYEYLFAGCFSLKRADFSIPAISLKDYCYYYMFYYCTNLIKTPSLPAMQLAKYSYSCMFYGCINLITAPEIPATIVAPYCCESMFSDCYDLTFTPSILSAIKLEEGCYASMFFDCYSIKTTPDLPATNLAENCYHDMFYGCTSLTKAPKLPAKILASRCYEGMFDSCSFNVLPELPATTLANRCYYEMFECNDSIKVVPANFLPVTTLKEYCYCYMFYECNSLEIAPELPAQILVKGCYYEMFKDCYMLEYLKVGFGTPDSEDWPSAESCTYCWLFDAGMDADDDPIFEWKGTDDPSEDLRDTSHVPEDWTIKSY